MLSQVQEEQRGLISVLEGVAKVISLHSPPEGRVQQEGIEGSPQMR